MSELPKCPICAEPTDWCLGHGVMNSATIYNGADGPNSISDPREFGAAMDYAKLCLEDIDDIDGEVSVSVWAIDGFDPQLRMSILIDGDYVHHAVALDGPWEEVSHLATEGWDL